MSATPEVPALAASPELDALAFHVLLWVAGADDDVEAEEVEVFHKMLARRGWCASRTAHAVLPRTAASYAELWQRHGRAGAKGRDLDAVRAGLRAAERLVPADDLPAFKRDLARLADAIARAAGGFLGLGAINVREQEALRALNDALREAPQPAPMGPLTTAAADAPPLRWQQGRLELRCVALRDEARDLRTFVFTSEQPVVFDYLPGQFVTLEAPVGDKPVLRSYSLSSTPTRGGTLELTVKRVPGGLVSNWMHDHLRVGMRVAVRGPAGRFTCGATPAERLLLLSAGSGITPVLSMARYLRDTRAPADVVFLHSAKTLADVGFADELRAMARENPRFRLVLALTQAGADEAHAGPRGRVSEELLLASVPDYRKRTVYVCGPTPFMETTRGALTALGFPMERYFAESFGGAAPKGAAGVAPSAPARPARRAQSSLVDLLPAPEAPPSREPPPLGAHAGAAGAAPRPSKPAAPVLRFARSGRELALDAESTLLEQAEQVGVSIANACRAGVCGSCKCRVVEGDVDPGGVEGLSAAERSEGYVLACVAKARGRAVLDA